MVASNLNASVNYEVSFPKANQHYAQITIEVDKAKSNVVRFSMPVWTPGSYKVREFSQHVDKVWYEAGDGSSNPVRIDKNTWECAAKKGDKLRFTYELYAFKLGVRTSYIDQHMAFLHGPSAFIYAEGYENEQIEILFKPLEQWKNIEMPLPRSKKANHTFECANYDLLADSPVALGNFDINTYHTAGVPHTIVMIGTGNYDMGKVTSDFKKITDEEAKMFDNKHPSDQYIHFIQNVDKGGGGLEHLNCQTSQVNRWVYDKEEPYLKFLGLISHEYFHLWNVKRIRPIELGPFDYNKENYTELLWVAEGITSYFDDLFLKRAGFHTDESYLKAVAYNINRLENQPGKNVMSLDQSSKLAWVKAYLSNENSNNVTISYYNKGMLVAWMLDVEIFSSTNGDKRLDDVMLTLFNRYYKDLNRGFSYSEFVETCADVCGKPMNDFFDRYTKTTEALPYDDYLKTTGYALINKAEEKPSLGITTKSENGKCVISFVRSGSSAAEAGLSVNDELISINGWRIIDKINTSVPGYNTDTEVDLVYARDGRMYGAKAALKKSETVKYEITAEEVLTEEQKKFQKVWLN